MNYIVTGSTSFIGAHLTNLIKERYPNAKYITSISLSLVLLIR